MRRLSIALLLALSACAASPAPVAAPAPAEAIPFTLTAPQLDTIVNAVADPEYRAKADLLNSLKAQWDAHKAAAEKKTETK